MHSLEDISSQKCGKFQNAKSYRVTEKVFHTLTLCPISSYSFDCPETRMVKVYNLHSVYVHMYYFMKCRQLRNRSSQLS